MDEKCVQEEAEFEKDGRKHIKRPPVLSLARVSVVRGEPGDRFGEAFLDDYINTQEHVDDFLTQYSGVVKEDLDPEMSDKYLTTLKVKSRSIAFPPPLNVVCTSD
jgi:PAB-dependent poly(A)-specific ribonuclease subunit 2